MEKERQIERRDDPPPVERDDVRVAGNRCPYCHEDVARETADVCRDCLARHHGGCWTEGQRCGACGSAHVLRPVLPPLTPARLRELFGAALRREGYSEADIERVVPPPLDRCPMPGCLQRGVARVHNSPVLLCAPHAAANRSSTLGVGVTLVVFGLAALIILGGVAIAQEAVAPFATGAALCTILGGLGALIIRQLSNLPPITEAPAPDKTTS